ncbi:diaminopropionate ammonia-lyase [Veillonella magna]|uniref:Diaminopropionate ammonia-lyase n=1 Tax=Veillonella magna TaxID=464322 RepID=A0ABS2GFT8_9FIRM|nr:diaminopropionate ammonia-lyase [Veillonella magna]MBM6823603.1 diaminopropionate ammonia-lyase [Veillonella magna]MBM6912133.1 diaminopropionate ammonia-lyase [Veillonella magna]
MDAMKWVVNTMTKSEDKNLAIMSIEEGEKARAFHQSFPQYEVTPLTELPLMADYLGLGTLFVKDESYRFGLNAFKVLGGSYSMAKYVAQKLGKDVSELTYDVFTSEELRKEFGQATFFTATDGNHGRGVAWAAKRLGQKAVIFMPKGTTETRLKNIEKEGATVTIEELNYDDCVRKAVAEAAKVDNGVVVQDTAWDGYEEIPSWIMQGYGTMALEAGDQLNEKGVMPTHIFVQAGVGSLAGAVTGYFTNLYKDAPVKPKIIVVEAQAADCLYQGALAGDGKPRIVGGDLQTIQAGLACGEPNTISWDILRNHVDVFVSAPDWVAELGMRMTAAPLKGDKPIVSGESGAVPFGTVAAIMTMDAYKELRDELGLGKDSKVLCFSTEGDTDPIRYKEIVWEGKNF